MNNLIPEGYQFKEIRYPEQERTDLDDRIEQLQKIVLDRSIPEKNKVLVNKELTQLVDMKAKLMPGPQIILEKIE